MFKDRRTRWILSAAGFALFLSGVGLAVSTLGALPHYAGVACSLFGAILADFGVQPQ